MLLKGLFLIILIVIIAIVSIALVVLRFLWKGFHFIRKMTDADDARTNRHNRDYTGRRQQHYSYNTYQNQGNHQNSKEERQGQKNTHVHEDITIVDMRNPEQTERRIFSDEEGEYIEFEEEK